MFHSETFLKFLVALFLSALVHPTFGSTLKCQSLFQNTDKLNRLTWQESSALSLSTIRTAFSRWKNKDFELTTASGTKISGTTKLTPHKFVNSYISDQPASVLQVQLHFTANSKEQAKVLIEEIYERHAAWIAAGKNLNKIPEQRQNLPKDGPGEILKFEISKASNGLFNVRVFTEYLPDPSVAEALHLEIFSALFFTGIQIDSETLVPPPRKQRINLE